MDILAKIESGADFSFEEALEFCRDTPLGRLCEAADALRKKYFQNKIETCSIVNARSGRCPENCKWCAQSAHYKTSAEVYPLMRPDEILKKACEADRLGIRRFSFVTSGRALTDADVDSVCECCALILKSTSLKLCASLGLLNKGQLAKLKAAGIGRYHCNLETAPSFFPKLCSTHTPEDKIATLRAAREAGMELCSGGIIGMGESFEQRVELAFALRRVGADSIPVNILNPIKGTPLEGEPALSEGDILRAFATFRIVNPKAQIRFAGGRTNILDFQRKALKSGVSAAIVGDMLTTVGAKVSEDFKMFSEMGYDY